MATKSVRLLNQRLEQDVIHKFLFPVIVKSKESKQFVFVLPKFVLGEKEKLLLELQELKGNRKVVLNK